MQMQRNIRKAYRLKGIFSEAILCSKLVRKNVVLHFRMSVAEEKEQT